MLQTAVHAKFCTQ